MLTETESLLSAHREMILLKRRATPSCRIQLIALSTTPRQKKETPDLATVGKHDDMAIARLGLKPRATPVPS